MNARDEYNGMTLCKNLGRGALSWKGKRGMNKTHIRNATILLALISMPTLCPATVWVDKTVAQLQSYVVGGDCLYFTLTGVTEADPVFPGSAWFAISRTQGGTAAKDAY